LASRARARAAAIAALLLILASAPSGAMAPAEMLQGRLVVVERGRLVPVPPLSGNVPVLFYFGAGWCGPCRAFVPALKQADAAGGAGGDRLRQ